ncbi:bifunctional 5,10-methylenetetrahydrofolate dehydrogenase (NADP+/NAD+)/methenyltetrahydrofolate cyclohydrolase [Gottschalkia acidurici 9a]|uniref:methenyltetrahydrofolate cyclohydrolase n=1 Tax=Gottschalkia acidurici (strain ATCC 7906 / DSM 604 / BCRC 14475 / CIP 104303 / KCTC 5404 / NCIMB 10678 / 9a) TaxID=1128398 RepID=K0AZ69_GOTA9|nr:bifunctional 5,10-methylenetetrahydrofolate dehydrogenase/5,10-methenyltetrahydrofolate cyclohydrolase [Gottschalkia acidurici]AFS77990.1 bifunctional 5,10-methylenetetrahydrofolate dehydrogenase (NADP+/NAD+)/methenyltetrahydrofolate cyclohydrolase [Gottschalkia acidurici 9a]
MGRIDVQKISDDIRAELKEKMMKLENKPTLAIILVGDDPASVKYVESKGIIMREMGAGYQSYVLPEQTTEKELLDLIEKLNSDDSVHGILVQLPLPNKEIDEEKIVKAILPSKDVDGFNEGGAPPCTALGIMKIFEKIGYKLEGRKVAVLGTNITIGEPIVPLLKNEGVEVLNLDTDDSNKIKEELFKFEPQAIVSAMDIKGLVSASDLPESVEVFMDGGAIRELQEDGKYKSFGDFNHEEYDILDNRNIKYTYRVKGVGIMILTMLAYNLLERYEVSQKK